MYLYIHTYICIHIYVHPYIYIYVYMYTRMYLCAHGTPQTKFAFSQRTLASSEEALETLETGNFFQKSSLTGFTI